MPACQRYYIIGLSVRSSIRLLHVPNLCEHDILKTNRRRVLIHKWSTGTALNNQLWGSGGQRSKVNVIRD